MRASAAMCGEGGWAQSRGGAAAAAVNSGSSTAAVQRSPITAADARTAAQKRRRSASVSSAGGTIRSASTSASAACEPSHSTGAHWACSAADAHAANAAAAASSKTRNVAVDATASDGAVPTHTSNWGAGRATGVRWWQVNAHAGSQRQAPNRSLKPKLLKPPHKPVWPPTVRVCGSLSAARRPCRPSTVRPEVSAVARDRAAAHRRPADHRRWPALLFSRRSLPYLGVAVAVGPGWSCCVRIHVANVAAIVYNASRAVVAATAHCGRGSPVITRVQLAAHILTAAATGLRGAAVAGGGARRAGRSFRRRIGVHLGAV